jgi:hypothetical protein
MIGHGFLRWRYGANSFDVGDVPKDFLLRIRGVGGPNSLSANLPKHTASYNLPYNFPRTNYKS